MTTKSLTDVPGIGPSTANALTEHGIKTAEDLANASATQIAAVPGFSAARAASAKKAAAELLAGTAKPAPTRRAAPKKAAPRKAAARKAAARKRAHQKPASTVAVPAATRVSAAPSVGERAPKKTAEAEKAGKAKKTKWWSLCC